MKKFIAMAAAASACAALQAQKINPTLEVTGTYEGKIVEIQKPEEKMTVPDSVLRFDLDFDYSVFANPYKGAYDFKPYAVNMKPQPMPEDRRRFYLRAGTGYPMHPEAEVEYKLPSASGKWDTGMYLKHHSYFGDYHQIHREETEGDNALLTTGSYYSGKDALTRAGLHAGYVWKTGEIALEAGYRNLLTEDFLASRRADGFDAALSVRSVRQKGFLYDAALQYGFDRDRIKSSEGDPLAENRVVFTGVFGSSLKGDSKLLIGFEGEAVKYSGALDAYVGCASVTPQYQFVRNGINFSLGAKVSVLACRASAGTKEAYGDLNGQATQWIYPDIHLSFPAVPDRLVFYVQATGGNDLHAYSSTVAENHFFSYGYAHPGPLLDNTVERFNAAAGFRGNIASRFHFDVSGGYAMYAGRLFEGLASLGGFLVPSVVFADCGRMYAVFSCAWRSAHVSADGKIVYEETKFDGDAGDRAVLPPAFTGDFRFAYDWKGRIRGGVTWNFASERECRNSVFTVPWYGDLGLFGEYSLSQNLAVWAKGGNLLNMTLQRVPLHAERGLYVTGGICLLF